MNLTATNIIAIITTSILWLVGLTVYFVKIHMGVVNVQDKIKTVENKHEDCYKQREQKEEMLLEELNSINKTLSSIETNLDWLKQKGPE